MDTSKLRIFIQTLPHRPERHWGQIGMLEAMKFPMNQVEVVYGVNGRAWESVKELENQAMLAGFEFLKNKKGDRKGLDIHGRIGCQWSVCRLLVDIIRTGKPALLMEDDYYFSIDWKRLEKRLKMLPGDFQVAVLGYTKRPSSQNRLNAYWLKGAVAPGQKANIYTPEGAQRVLDAYRESSRETIEKVIGDLFKDDEHTYSIIPPIVYTSLAQGESDIWSTKQHNKPEKIDLVKKWKEGYNPE